MTEDEARIATPLLVPAAGTPPVIADEDSFKSALTELAKGAGPFAVDAERASGYRYSSRAYLIQIKRNGGGLHLIDPIPFGPGHQLFVELNDLLNSDEVILHASTQDLPCLRELGINPKLLFDTELGGRIAGLPRVGLGPLLEAHLDVLLAKERIRKLRDKGFLGTAGKGNAAEGRMTKSAMEVLIEKGMMNA